MTPNAPGRWWREAHGETVPVKVLRVDGGLYVVAPHTGSGLVPVEEAGGAWLGPIAPLGSVAPDVVARLVRDAYLTAWADALSEHRDLIRLRSKIRAEARDVETWLASDQSRALHAALTAAGADADAVIAEVER